MSRQPQSVHWDSLEHDKAHREKVIAKWQKIQTLRALVEMHEADPNCDHEYLLALRARVRSAENQYKAFSL
jgi:hypothetical protein